MKRSGILATIITFLLVPLSLQAIPVYHYYDLGNFGFALNDNGQVAAADEIGHLLLWEDGVVSDLGLISSGGFGVHDINNSEQIVGSLNESAYLWENGNVIDLGTTGVNDSPATAINNKGQVVGYQHTTDAGSPYHAWLWDSVNGIQDIDSTGYSFAFDINDQGTVVGRVYSPFHQPAIWENGTLDEILPFEGQAEGINNLGQAVGTKGSPSQHTAFLWENGVETNLGSLGGNSSAKDINDYGQVVGESKTEYGAEEGTERAFIWFNGEMNDLNSLLIEPANFTLLDAKSINNNGQIVCRADVDGQFHSIFLDPEWDALVTPDQIYYFEMTLGSSINFDYWWEMNEIPSESCILDILVNRIDTTWESIGQIVSDVATPVWMSSELEVPIELWQIETQIRFNFTDCDPVTNTLVFLRNISTSYVPEITIDSILYFFNESVAGGSLEGYGPGKSAANRLKAFRNKLESAGELIDSGYIEEACGQLDSCYKKCDGLPKPIDFVAGEAAPDLMFMIEDLMDYLKCE